MRKNKKAGFTLIELLVVIAIIGVLAGIGLASLNDARTKAENAQVIAQMQQFSQAIERFAIENGRYPDASSVDQRACIGVYPADGDFSAGECVMAFGSPVVETNALFDSEFTAQFGNNPQHNADNLQGASNGLISFRGYIYAGTPSLDSYTIDYYLKGENSDCGLPNVVSSNVDGSTVCTATFSL